MCIKKYTKNLRNLRVKKAKKSQPTRGKDFQRQQKNRRENLRLFLLFFQTIFSDTLFSDE